MMAEKLFKTIEIHDNEFVVSSLGEVYKDGEKLRQNENHDGYLVVYVGNNRSMGVHRLVAMAFIPNSNPAEKNEVNHIDFNRKNNEHTNLEWLSHGENVRYSHKNGRYKRRYGKDNPNFGNKKLSKMYSENHEIALEKQSRKGSQNGKSKKIKLYKDNSFIKEFDYIGDCCKYLSDNYGFSSNAETVRCGIRRSIKHNRPYKGFTFIK
jgi:hypothetical protein